MKNIIAFILLLFILTKINCAFSQISLQVASKEIIKKIEADSITLIKLDLEKTDIEIKSSTEKYIVIKTTLISKHPDKKTAINGLKYINFNIEKNKNVCNINNHIKESNSKISNQIYLKSKIVMKIPSGIKIYLVNYLGNISITDINEEAIIYNKYGKIILSGLNNTKIYNTYFAEIEAYKLKGNHTFETNFADIKFNNCDGNYIVNSDNAKIKIIQPYTNFNINLVSRKSDIYFKLNSINDHNIYIDAINSNLIGKLILESNYIKKTKKTIIYQSYTKNIKSKIKITSNECNLIIN